jgi:AraC-like DNA-binding protein
MARPSKELPSRSSLVPAIVRHAAARGMDVEALALRFGLTDDVAACEEATTAADVADELLRTVARVAGEPDVALRVATELTSRPLTLGELAVKASATVRDGLVRLARWVPLLHEGLEAFLEEDVDEGRWVLRTPRRPRGAGRFVHELALAHTLHQVRAGAEDVRPSRVWFTHARPPELSPTRAFFGTSDLAFGCEDSGFALARGELELPMRLADARTVHTLTPLLEAELGARTRGVSLTERVAKHLAASLPEATDVAEVARAMHMGARTLQRRLEQEQTRFTEVLDQARLEVARRLLGDPAIALTDVAFRLGFADLATFSRAFKRWTGKPPGQWRRS